MAKEMKERQWKKEGEEMKKAAIVNLLTNINQYEIMTNIQ